MNNDFELPQASRIVCGSTLRTQMQLNDLKGEDSDPSSVKIGFCSCSGSDRLKHWDVYRADKVHLRIWTLDIGYLKHFRTDTTFVSNQWSKYFLAPKRRSEPQMISSQSIGAKTMRLLQTMHLCSCTCIYATGSSRFRSSCENPSPGPMRKKRSKRFDAASIAQHQ